MRSSNLAFAAALALFVACKSDAVPNDGVYTVSSIDAVEKLAWKLDTRATHAPVDAGALRVLAGSKLHVVETRKGALDEGVTLGEEPTTAFTVAEGSLYYGAKSSLVAASLHDGAVVWSAKLPRSLQHAPVYADGSVIVAAGDLVAVDPFDGAERWRFKGEAKLAARPSVLDATAYAVDESGRVHAVETSAGQKRWTYDADAPLRDDLSPAVNDELVIVVGIHGTLYAIFRHNGREKWRYRSEDVVSSRPAIRGDRVYTGTEAGALVAVNARTGQEVWRRDDLAAVVTPVAWAGGRLHFGCDDGMIHAVDAEDGATRWSFQLESEPLGAPILRNRAVIAADRDGRLYMIE